MPKGSAQKGIEMKMSKSVLVLCAVIATGVGVAWAAGDWSSARSQAEDFKNRQHELKRMTPDETKRIVTAICAADEEGRRDAGLDIADRVSRTVREKHSSLERARDDALRAIDNVLSDENLKDNHSDARSLKEDVKTRWESIEKMTLRLRGANHPVVSWMLDQGNRAHVDRQYSCDAKEISLNSGRLDCAMATGETCTVVELKPDNSNAISKGRDQARRYREDLNEELKKPDSSYIGKLIAADRDFANCKRFESRVDCYTLCPAVDENGDHREVSASWRKDC